jgi:undecaprenyl-diphosphatase
MSESGAGPATHDAGIIPSTPFPATSPLAAALSFLTVGACCVALMQLDIPLLRFLRSLDLSSMQRVGDLGEKVGNGASLAALSVSLLGVGWIAGRKQWMQAGVDSLLAHGCVGLVVNGLKHLIGRPRPRLTHSGGWQWWPSWESGLDSFPSGHTSATFAVATVLARRWPHTAWVGYGLATWVAMSRVWRGSHFITDVVAGMVAGVVVGTVFAHPLREWRKTLLRAMADITPIAVAGTSAVWLVLHRVDTIWMDRLVSIMGVALLAAGFLIRLKVDRGTGLAWLPLAYRASKVLMGLGLACTTGAPVLVGLTALAASAWWFQARGLYSDECGIGGPSSTSRRPPLKRLHAVGIVLAVFLIWKLKGIIPIQ